MESFLFVNSLTKQFGSLIKYQTYRSKMRQSNQKVKMH